MHAGVVYVQSGVSMPFARTSMRSLIRLGLHVKGFTCYCIFPTSSITLNTAQILLSLTVQTWLDPNPNLVKASSRGTFDPSFRLSGSFSSTATASLAVKWISVRRGSSRRRSGRLFALIPEPGKIDIVVLVTSIKLLRLSRPSQAVLEPPLGGQYHIDTLGYDLTSSGHELCWASQDYF